MSLDRNKTLGRHAYMFAALTKSRKSGADSKYDGIGAAELQHLTPGVYTIPGLHLSAYNERPGEIQISVDVSMKARRTAHQVGFAEWHWILITVPCTKATDSSERYRYAHDETHVLVAVTVQ